MSIVIKTNELHTIIYKYLLEAGLTHTAYVMFNEAKLQTALQEFKFDIKSGHLLTLIQKALTFSLLQSHANLGDYSQCLQPFYLLKLHTCKLTMKQRKDNSLMMKELNNNINDCIKRTNAIYNTELPNKIYDEIVYEPRGANYFQKFSKLRFSEGDMDLEHKESKGLQIGFDSMNSLAFYNKEDKLVYLTQKGTYDDVTIDQIYPCTLNGNVVELQLFKITESELIMVFLGNQIKIISRKQDKTEKQLTVSVKQEIKSIELNPNFSNIICFQSGDEHCVINTKNMQEIMSDKGVLKWRSYDEFILFQDGHLRLKSLLKSQTLIEFKCEQCYLDQIQVSRNKTFFYTISYQKGRIEVYTFQKEEPLYVFDFANEEETLKKAVWVYRNEIDYLTILTDSVIRVWDVELNSYSYKIDIDKYNIGQVSFIASLEKNQGDTFLLALGQLNLLVADIANQKIQRIQSPLDTTLMSNAGQNLVVVSTNESIYFLTGDKLSQLFI